MRALWPAPFGLANHPESGSVYTVNAPGAPRWTRAGGG